MDSLAEITVVEEQEGCILALKTIGPESQCAAGCNSKMQSLQGIGVSGETIITAGSSGGLKMELTQRVSSNKVSDMDSIENGKSSAAGPAPMAVTTIDFLTGEPVDDGIHPARHSRFPFPQLRKGMFSSDESSPDADISSKKPSITTNSIFKAFKGKGKQVSNLNLLRGFIHPVRFL